MIDFFKRYFRLVYKICGDNVVTNCPTPLKRKSAKRLSNNHLADFLRGTTRNRTGDTRIFSPLLYQLSYGTIRDFLVLHSSRSGFPNQSWCKDTTKFCISKHFVSFFLFSTHAAIRSLVGRTEVVRSKSSLYINRYIIYLRLPPPYSAVFSYNL